MFMNIATKGATNILVYIPHEAAPESLPAITRMFEENATFVEHGWQESKVVQPEITIHLGDSYTMEGNDRPDLVFRPDLVLPPSESVLCKKFQHATPEVMIETKKILDRLRQDLNMRNDKIRVLEAELRQLQERLDEQED